MNDALRDWVSNVDDTYYLIGTVAGPHPYPAMVRDFQSVIGIETREQMQAAKVDFRIHWSPVSVAARTPWVCSTRSLMTRMYGLSAWRRPATALKAANTRRRLTGGSPGVLHGNRTYLLQDDDGQILDAHSISAGLDYPGIGPEHSWLNDSGRVEYVSVTDDEALDGFQLCSRP